ncbi:MAG: hypothetical protein L6R39_003509 [Caloplaca ligustica]|nr:MAG: hypothetical protein L6R39_003509 [Caloplaca ligustica]
MCTRLHVVGRDNGLLAKVKETDVFEEDCGGGMEVEKTKYHGSSPWPPVTRKPRASFSGFGQVVCTFPSRIASHRRKNSVMADNTLLNLCNYGSQDTASRYEKSLDDSSVWDTIDPPPQARTPGWLRRCVSTRFRPRRQTADTPSRPATAHLAPDDFYSSPIPVNGVAQPTFLDDLSSGTAARAAAAEQSEMRRCRCFRRLCAKERRVRGDSESGIGIDVQSTRRESAIARLDPVLALPRELFTHILSYLDTQTLINSELVSRQWHSVASDDLMWRRVFHKDFRPQSQAVTDNSTMYHIRSQGLGSAEAEQDWKKMWRTRKALHQRWLDSHAAAIYLEGHYDSVYCVQFDEDKIVTGSRDRTIRIWDARTYKCIKVMGVPSRNHPINLPALTGKTGHRPFTTCFCRQFKLEPYAGRPDIYHIGSILCLQYDDELMITGSSDFTCIMWDIKADWRPIRRVQHHTAGVLDVCFDKKHVLSCSKDTTVCLWDRETGDLIHRLLGHRGPVNAVQLRGTLAVSASGDGVAKLWNIVSGNCIKEFPSKDRGMACVEFSPDSRTIFAGGNDQVIYQFDASTGELIREMNGHSGLVRSLHLDSANGRLVSGSYDNTVRAYDIHTGQPIVQLAGWTASWILSAKLDYRRIIATSQDSRVVIIDFGFNLPGTELLEHRRRPSLGSTIAGMGRLRI